MIVIVNNKGDLAFTHKDWIGKECELIKITRSGMAYIKRLSDGKTTTVPQKNIK